MNDLVARLRAQPTERTYDSVGRAYDFPKHLIEEAASRISQQDAELERLRREVEEAKEFRAILEGHLSAAIDDYNEARKAAFIDAAEIATATGTDAENDWPGETWIAYRIAAALRAKAEGQP